MGFSIGALALATALTAAPAATTGALEAQVRAAETAFAKTMADRDHAAFTGFLSEEALFVGSTVSRGKAAVAAAWKPYFDGDGAPFSWAPDDVVVVESGSLALTSGPVRDPAGRRIGTFNSVWRREPDGTWKIVLDRGCPPCDCAAKPAAP